MADHAPVFPSQPAAAPPPVARSKSPMRWLVPLVMFVVIVGGIAWLVQNMPSWRAKTAVVPALPKGPDALLGFVHPITQSGYFVAPWEPLGKDDLGKPLTKKPYAREFERNEEGKYCFPFLVRSEQAVEIGSNFKSCDCAKLSIAVITPQQSEAFRAAMIKDPGLPPADEASLDWKSLDKTDDKGVIFPGGAHAIFRMVWTNRRNVGEALNLKAHLWARSPGDVSRQTYAFAIEAVSAHPLRTKNPRIDVGGIDPDGHAKAEFLVWSPTRDQLKFALNDRVGDSLFRLDVRPLSPNECAELQTKLRGEDILTRVRAAWKVNVTVHENNGKHQLDQGHFIRAVTIDVPEASEDIPALYVVGRVQGEVRVGAADANGKINLGPFQAQFGTEKRVVLAANNRAIDLEIQSAPPTLRCAITEEKSTKSKQWQLRVEVPPGAVVGAVPDDFAVILRIKGTKRSIRIPIVGSGVQG